MVWTCCWVIYQSTLLWSRVSSDVGSFSFLHSVCCSLGLFPQKTFCLDRPRYPCKKSLFPVFQFACFVAFPFASKVFFYFNLYLSPPSLPLLGEGVLGQDSCSQVEPQILIITFLLPFKIYLVKIFNIRIIFNSRVFMELWFALFSTCINFLNLSWHG